MIREHARTRHQITRLSLLFLTLPTLPHSTLPWLAQPCVLPHLPTRPECLFPIPHSSDLISCTLLFMPSCSLLVHCSHTPQSLLLPPFSLTSKVDGPARPFHLLCSNLTLDCCLPRRLRLHFVRDTIKQSCSLRGSILP